MTDAGPHFDQHRISPTLANTDDPVRDERLRRVVERHVIPRLVLRSPKVIRPERFGDKLSQEVQGLTDQALHDEGDRSRALLRRLHAEGASFSDLQLGLLAPAARRLGWLWKQDAVNFVDVALAAGSLQHLMRFVSLDLIGTPPPGVDRSILVAPVPGANHVFGAAMAAEFFRQSGWRVQYEPRPSAGELVQLVSRGWVDVVGLSITARRDLPGLADLINELRLRSRNPHVTIIGGGELMVEDPSLVGKLGLDAIVAAIEAAPRQLQEATSPSSSSAAAAE